MTSINGDEIIIEELDLYLLQSIRLIDFSYKDIDLTDEIPYQWTAKPFNITKCG